MATVFKNAMMYENGVMKKQNMLFDGASLSVFKGETFPCDATVIDNTVIFPGFCDVHVHFREPGFSYKETMETGSAAAARGGYTATLTMPNLNPTPDSAEHVKLQLKRIEEGAKIAVYPYGTITVGEAGESLSDMEGIADDVIAFSDDGRGVQSPEMMEEAMRRAKALGKMIVAHCEDNSLLRGGYIHDGEYAKAHGHRGICSESEYGPIKRDIELIEKTGCPYHVCHISTKESVEAIREAKRRGIDISCETGPHYLTMDDSMLEEDGRFKMNPPIRSREDRDALVAGLLDGTIDMIATDHAPHSAEEKSRGLEKSAMGVVGLETAFAVLYTKLVRTGVITLERLCELMSKNPRERFGIKSDAGFTVFDIGEEYTVNPEEFASMGKATPFKDWKVYGRCLLTVYGGGAVYADKKIK
ncbi:MAG: dihydroorotase [Ruminococcaceae bacterium]|nr:dihydroorotase [Oscillospiraceae bacterium]